MKKKERNGAPLIEIIVSIGILALVGSIVVTIFLGAYYAAIYSSDKNAAVFTAQNTMEAALTGSEEELLGLGFEKNGEGYIAYFDKEWSADGDRLFSVELSISENDGLRSADVEIKRIEKYPFLNESRMELYTLSGLRCYSEVRG
jgi:type II secretory pathway pseudopilin PulG